MVIHSNTIFALLSKTWYNNIPICSRDSVRQVKWFNLLWVVTVFCACFMSVSVFLSVLILYYSIILLLFYIILYTIILIFVWRIRLLKVHAFIVLEWIYFLSYICASHILFSYAYQFICDDFISGKLISPDKNSDRYNESLCMVQIEVKFIFCYLYISIKY